MSERHLGDSVAALADGHLTGEARDQALAHLAACDACRSEVEQHRAVRQRLSTLAAPAPPLDITASLLRLAPYAPEKPVAAASPAGLPPLERPAAHAFRGFTPHRKTAGHKRRAVAAGVLAAAALGGGATLGTRQVSPSGGAGPAVTPGSLELTRFDDTSRPLVIDDPAPVLAVVLRR